MIVSKGQLVDQVPVPLTTTSHTPFSQSSARTDRATELRAMRMNGTLGAIVGRIAVANAAVTWHLYRKPRGRRIERQEVFEHPALTVWNKPNNFMTRSEFVESFSQHVELCGEGWWILGRGEQSAVPLDMWPVRPDRMSVVPSATDFIAGYVYTSPDGVKIPLERDEVIMIRVPDPEDIYRGMSPVGSVLTDLQATHAAAAWNRNFFLNSAEPGGVIEAPSTLNDTEFQRLRTQWNENHRGTSKAHRVAILENGLKWVGNGISQRDMQFSELLQNGREAVREAYAYPKPMLGAVDDVNRANAEAGEYVFAKHHQLPRLDRIKGALNNEFLPLFGPLAEGYEFDYESPVPEDEVAEIAEFSNKVNAAKTLIDAGFDPVETLAALELPPITYRGKGGDSGPSQVAPDAEPAA